MAELLQPENGYDWRCQRCGHQWCSPRPRQPDALPPVHCAKCRSAYWTRPKKTKIRLVKAAKTAPAPAVEATATDIYESRKMPRVPFEIQALLPPPPHLRNQPYYPPVPEPTPEDTIRRTIEPAEEPPVEPVEEQPVEPDVIVVAEAEPDNQSDWNTDAESD